MSSAPRQAEIDLSDNLGDLFEQIKFLASRDQVGQHDSLVLDF